MLINIVLTQHFKKFLVTCFALAFVPSLARACTISENMYVSLPLNTTEIPNSSRIEIANMVVMARQWPDVDIRGIVYAGGYVKERNPKKLATQRAESVRSYLIQLGIKAENIWTDLRTIKNPDRDANGNKALHQISVALVPICEGGCDRLCNDPRLTPNSRVVK